MSNQLKQIPLFPLNLVPFEGEPVNLHIFEERYKEMVTVCQQEDIGFGIVPFINGQLCAYGGYMRITEVVKEYSDGRLDIRSMCESRFRLDEYQNPARGHSYAGGTVHIMDADPVEPAKASTQEKLHDLVHRLYALLQSPLDAQKLLAAHTSYALGHKIGLSLDQEYELFLLTHEEERQAYLIDHLARTLPSLEEFNRTRTLIHLNGHFQKFDPLSF
jgi:Lon protease-like protein